QRLALEQLRDDEADAVFSADVEDDEDVRVVERRGGTRLLLEAAPPIRLERRVGREHFHRDVAIEPGVARTVHRAHAARANRCQDFVRTDARPGSYLGHAGILGQKRAGLTATDSGDYRRATD